MLKAILMVLLSVVSTSATAREFVWAGDTHAPPGDTLVNPNAVSEWVKVASQKTYIIFVNPASIRKVGNNVEMWHLYELQIIDVVAGKPFRSVKALAEYNCMKEQSRTLTAAAYSGKMGRNEKIVIPGAGNTNLVVEGGSGGSRAGVVNRISEPGKWKSVSSGSTEEILWKIACGK